MPPSQTASHSSLTTSHCTHPLFSYKHQTFHDGSTCAEEVLWHATLSHNMEHEREAEAAAAAQKRSSGGNGGRQRAARQVVPAVELHMLNPDLLMSGMVTQAAIEPRLNKVFAE